MSVTIRCPNCRGKYQVPEKNLGARATCKQCGQTFTVEMAADETVGLKPGEARTQPESLVHFGEVEEARKAIPPAEPAPDAAHSLPQKIGPYTVRRRLGGGAMGEVWLAWDPALQRDVAIKTLRPEVALSAQGLDRFLREARSAAKLHHTNAVSVYQVGVEGKTPYIAMEYVEGQSLDAVVSPGQPMAWREATRAIRDAAAGLAAAHKLGLIHRDVKPANLMRTSDGVTKVVDFGLARAQAAQTQITQRGAILGTPAYMAPEVWGRKEPDARSDLYALACTYYCLLTGEPPFDADNPVALGYQHTQAPLPDPRQRVPALPNGVCHILVKGASKDPDQRYQTAAEILEELEALLATPHESLVFDAPKPDAHVFARVKASVTQGITQVVGRTLPALARTVSEGISRISRSRFGLVAVASTAFVLTLGIMLSIRTGHGTVKIELSDPNAQVEVKVDGETIDITGLKEPLRLKAGKHHLIVTSGDYQSVSKSFTVRRGGQDVLRVTLEPNIRSPETPPSTEVAVKPLIPPTQNAPGTDPPGAAAKTPPLASTAVPNPDHNPAPNPVPGAPVVTASQEGLTAAEKPNDSAPVTSTKPVDPPVSTGDALHPSASSVAAPVEVGYVKASDRQFLLVFDSRIGEWNRVPAGTKLVSGDHLIALPTYRPEIVLGRGVLVLLAGPTSVHIGPPNAQGQPRLRVDFGSVLISTVGVPRSDIDLELGGHSGTAVTASEIGAEVCWYLPPGVDPETEAAVSVARILATKGRVRWQGVGSPEETLLEPGQACRVIETQIHPVDIAQPPAWTQGLKQIDSVASDQLEPLVSVDRSVSLSLMERTNDRRSEVRSLACRCLAYLGCYESLVREFEDDRQRAFWPDDFDVLRDSVAFSSMTATNVRKTLETCCGRDAKDLYRLVWGYSPDQLTGNAAQQLVDFLGHESLSVRVLAFENLRRITGETCLYRPEFTRSRQSLYLRKWKELLKNGGVRYQSPPAPPWLGPTQDESVSQTPPRPDSDGDPRQER